MLLRKFARGVAERRAAESQRYVCMRNEDPWPRLDSLSFTILRLWRSFVRLVELDPACSHLPQAASVLIADG